MKNQTSRSLKFKVGLFVPLITVIILFVALYTMATLSSTGSALKDVTVLYDFEVFYSFHEIFSVLNVILLVILLVVYVNVYRKIKSEFAFGLIVFGFVFLLKDIFASPFVASVFGFTGFMSGLGPFIVLPDLFEFVIISILLYLNLKY